jgi:hypothetical protein
MMDGAILVWKFLFLFLLFQRKIGVGESEYFKERKKGVGGS